MPVACALNLGCQEKTTRSTSILASTLEAARGVCRALANFPTPGQLREEHRAIDSPSRHVVIPTPARDSVAVTAESDVGVNMPTAGFEDYINVGKLLEVNLNRHVDVVRLPFTFSLSAMAGGDLEMLW